MDDARLQAAVDASRDRLDAQRLEPDPAKRAGAGRAAELETTTDGLFPLSPAERLDMLAAFVRREREHRVRMLIRHQDRRDYWQRRVADADEALHHVEQLRKELL